MSNINKNTDKEIEPNRQKLKRKKVFPPVNEWQLLLIAFSFFTRIPVKIKGNITPHMLNSASRYFALVGGFVGAMCGLIYWLSAIIFPLHIAIILALATGILLTGAFHEDGWADVWDGFGGGWSVTDKLNIMKDSRIGTYGSASLIVLFLLKFEALTYLAELHPLYPIIAFLLGHTLSRVVATSLIFSMPYVQEDSLSKVKPLAQHLSNTSLVILITTGIVLLALCTQIILNFTYIAHFPLLTIEQSGLIILLLICMRKALVTWFTQQLKGYTGDCLGAGQQLCEIVIYLTLIAFNATSLQGVLS